MTGSLYEQTIYYPLEDVGQNGELQVSEVLGNKESSIDSTQELSPEDQEALQSDQEKSPFEKLTLIVDDSVTYQLDIKLVDDDQVWGGAAYNWTIGYSEIMTNNKIRFYVAKKDMPQLPSSGEDWQKLYNELQEKSAEHMPEMIYVREG